MSSTKIHPTAEIEDGAQIGANTIVWHICHVRTGARIGNHCSLGRNVFIDSHVVIGDRTRIGNNVSIFDGVTIADGVFVGPHVCFTNDKTPRVHNAGGLWSKGKTFVGKGASIGAGVTVVCGITIGEGAMIGAGTVVCRDIKPFEQVIRFSEHVCYVDKGGKPKQ